jgi:anti-sigma regulatory factor (Ser/Thr protein kinase)
MPRRVTAAGRAGRRAGGTGPDDLDDLSLFAEGGYGLQIARDAVDEVSYVRTPAGRNIWRLVKRF